MEEEKSGPGTILHLLNHGSANIGKPLTIDPESEAGTVQWRDRTKASAKLGSCNSLLTVRPVKLAPSSSRSGGVTSASPLWVIRNSSCLSGSSTCTDACIHSKSLTNVSASTEATPSREV